MSNSLVTNSNSAIFSTETMGQITHFANLMADGRTMLPAHLQGKPADCMAVALQAASWGMNPFVVAQKTHIVNGTLGYEAQLVNAVISSSRAIVGRFHYRTIGDWSKWQYKNVGTNGKTKHSGINERGLGVQVGAILAGETEITWDDPLYIETIQIRNSPLWQSRPLQQMKYLAVKYWARIYCPEVILGVYTPDELAPETAQAEREINPIRGASIDTENITVDDVFSEPAQTVEQAHAVNVEPNIDDVFGNDDFLAPRSKKDELMDLVNSANSLDELFEYGTFITEALEVGEISEDERLELKAAYQKTKNMLG